VTLLYHDGTLSERQEDVRFVPDATLALVVSLSHCMVFTSDTSLSNYVTMMHSALKFMHSTQYRHNTIGRSSNIFFNIISNVDASPIRSIVLHHILYSLQYSPTQPIGQLRISSIPRRLIAEYVLTQRRPELSRSVRHDWLLQLI
jgi:hypothetical protein